jgi:hypothetical protein
MSERNSSHGKVEISITKDDVVVNETCVSGMTADDSHYSSSTFSQPYTSMQNVKAATVQQCEVLSFVKDLRGTIESSMIQSGQLRRECICRLIRICQLKSKIGTSGRRQLRLNEKLDRICDKKYNKNRANCLSDIEELEESDIDTEFAILPKTPKEKMTRRLSRSLSRSFASVLFQKKIDIAKEKMKIDQQLRLSSRDKIIEAMKIAIKETQQILKILRERRFKILEGSVKSLNE